MVVLRSLLRLAGLSVGVVSTLAHVPAVPAVVVPVASASLLSRSFPARFAEVQLGQVFAERLYALRAVSRSRDAVSGDLDLHRQTAWFKTRQRG